MPTLNYRNIPIQIFWILWIAWTIILCLLMLSPSDGTVKNISGLFGGTEITDAIGHVILIGVEFSLFHFVLLHYLPEKRALWIATILILTFAIILELAQTMIPSRGTSLIDIAAAFIGVGIARWIISHLRFNAID